MSTRFSERVTFKIQARRVATLLHRIEGITLSPKTSAPHEAAETG